MRITIASVTFALVLEPLDTFLQKVESRLDLVDTRLEIRALRHRRRGEKHQQTPRRMSEAEAEAVLRNKQAADACTEKLGPTPGFAPVLGTKVNPEFMAYLKKHRACMRDKGVVQ